MGYLVRGGVFALMQQFSKCGPVKALEGVFSQCGLAEDGNVDSFEE